MRPIAKNSQTTQRLPVPAAPVQGSAAGQASPKTAALGLRDKTMENLPIPNPRTCEILQLVRLLEHAAPTHETVGEGGEPHREVVRFKSHIDFGFPTSQVNQLTANERQDENPAFTLESRLQSLLGRFGPMPFVFSEIMQRRIAEGDTAGVAFLDLFHHRLVSYWVRLRKAIQSELNTGGPQDNPYIQDLIALSGSALMPASTNLSEDAFCAPLSGVGLAVRSRKSAADLENLIGLRFNVPAQTIFFRGGWVPVGPEDQACLSAGPQAAVLGSDAVLGNRAWDAGSAFEVRLGPLAQTELADLLPTGPLFNPLCDLIRKHVEPGLQFSLLLQPQPSRQSQTRLGGADHHRRLGWTSRLASPNPLSPTPIRLTPASHPTT